MLGLIWFVQIVHYPLFSSVGEREFAGYEIQHSRLTAFVVGPPMLIEALSAIALVFSIGKRFRGGRFGQGSRWLC
jgi:hypothetical protein